MRRVAKRLRKQKSEEFDLEFGKWMLERYNESNRVNMRFLGDVGEELKVMPLEASESSSNPQIQLSKSDTVPLEKVLTEADLKKVTSNPFPPGAVRLYREFRYNSDTTGSPPNRILGNVLLRLVYNMFQIRQLLNVETVFHKTIQKHRATAIQLSDIIVDYYFIGRLASETEAFTTTGLGISLQGGIDRGFGDVPIANHIWGERTLKKAVQLPVNVLESVPLFLKHYAIFSLIDNDTVG